MEMGRTRVDVVVKEGTNMTRRAELRLKCMAERHGIGAMLMTLGHMCNEKAAMVVLGRGRREVVSVDIAPRDHHAWLEVEEALEHLFREHKDAIGCLGPKAPQRKRPSAATVRLPSLHRTAISTPRLAPSAR